MDKIPPIYQKVGKRISTLRKRQGMTQEALAEACDLSPNYISRIERSAQVMVTLHTLESLASALNVPLLQLFTFTEETLDDASLEETLRLLRPQSEKLIKKVNETLKLWLLDQEY